MKIQSELYSDIERTTEMFVPTTTVVSNITERNSLSGKLKNKPVLAYNGEVLTCCDFKESCKKVDNTVGSLSDPVTTEEMDFKKSRVRGDSFKC